MQGGEAIISAFSEEFSPKVGFLRATALFTANLVVSQPWRVDEIAPRLVPEALDPAIRDADEVRPRSFNIGQ